MNLLQHIRCLKAEVLFSLFCVSFFVTELTAKEKPGVEAFSLLQQNQIREAEQLISTLHHKTGADSRNFNTALVRYYENDYPRCIYYLQKIEHPGTIDHYDRLLALAYFHSGLTNDAFDVLENAIQHAQEDKNLHHLLLYLFYQAGEYEKALNSLKNTEGFNDWKLLFLTKTGKCHYDPNNGYALNETLTNQRLAILLKACKEDWNTLNVLAKNYLSAFPQDTLVSYLYWQSYEHQPGSSFSKKFSAFRAYTHLQNSKNPYSLQFVYLFERFWLYFALMILSTILFLILRKR